MRGGWRTKFSNWRIRRALRRVEECSLEALAEDRIARLKGTVQPLGDRLLTAPLSGRPCVFYSATVLRKLVSFTSQPPDGLVHDSILVTEERGVPFLFHDGAEVAVIDPTGATISCAYDHRTRSKALFDATAVQHELLARHDLLEQDWWNTSGLEYVEGILSPGEPIVVVGGGTREPDPDGRGQEGYRDASRTRFRFESTKRFRLRISDDPKAQ